MLCFETDAVQLIFVNKFHSDNKIVKTRDKNLFHQIYRFLHLLYR